MDYVNKVKGVEGKSEAIKLFQKTLETESESEELIKIIEKFVTRNYE